ncbi:MAG: hypothetical protein NTV17_17655 [Burkholderiales bacterium]|nr:hypothetical protein [Burkholderiales bacterium]
MPMPTHLLPTTVVGSYPQPDWLINRQMLSKMVPRTRVKELWRVAPEFLEQAQDDATLLAIRDMERAGIDIITDGEMRRESYSNRFATALEGMDNDTPGVIRSSAGKETLVPRVVARLRRTEMWNDGTWSFCAAIPRLRPRSPCPAHSPWRSRPRTSSTKTTKRWPWTSLRPSTQRLWTCRRPAPM